MFTRFLSFVVTVVLTMLAGCGESNESAASNDAAVVSAGKESGSLVTLTADAAEEVDAIRPDGAIYLRVFIKKDDEAECGFLYGMEYAATAESDDRVFESEGIAVIVDEKSAPYLNGTTISFQDGKQNGKRGFRFDNPNAVKIAD
jgi:iron-sulfur cluster assembly protein